MTTRSLDAKKENQGRGAERLAFVAGLVSIIIPTYNYASYLAKAVQSCLDQTYGKTEIIVVDDGSTDSTGEVAEGYGKKIVYVRQENGGVSSARNTGLERASGEFITFLDSDDSLTPDSIKMRVEPMLQDPELYAVTGEILSKHAFDEETPFGPAATKAYATTNLFEDILVHGFAGSPLLRTCHAGQFRFPVHISNGEDIAYYAKVFFGIKVLVLPDPVLVKLHHPECLSRDLVKIARQEAALISTVLDDPYYSGALEFLRAEFTAKRYLSLFRSFYLSGDFQKARGYYIKAVQAKPASLLKLRYLTKFLRGSLKQACFRKTKMR